VTRLVPVREQGDETIVSVPEGPDAPGGPYGQPPPQPGGGYPPPAGSPYGQGGQPYGDPGGGGGWGGQPPGGGGGWGGGPPPYGAGPPPSSARTDGKAIGAIISALVCPLIGGIVALVLAAQAARTIRESGGRVGGRGAVTAGRILGVLNIVGALAVTAVILVAAANAPTTEPTAAPAVTTAEGSAAPTSTTEGGTTGTTEASRQLAGDAYDDVVAGGVGTCLNDTARGEVVACDEPHDGELFGTFELEGVAYPGKARVDADAERGCRAEFRAFTGADIDEQTEYEAFIVTPERSSWVLGQREVACVLTGPSGRKLTGSARDSLA
jgi:Septum formation